MSSKRSEAANIIVEEAKRLVGEGDYRSAKSKVEEAIQKFPSVEYGKEMITVCELLQFSTQFKHSHFLETWPQILQIPSTSTDSEIKTRYRSLMKELKTLKGRFPCVRYADKFIREVLPMYAFGKRSSSSAGGKRKLVFPDDDDSDVDADNDTDEDSDADEAVEKEKEDGKDDPFAARSPEFKKLHKQIFTTLPQPHYRPLEKYCPSFRQVMKLGCEIIFVKLTQKLQNMGEDHILTQEEEDAIVGELINLEEMGYEVMKLRERFELLVRVKTFAEEDKGYAEKRKNLEGKISDDMVLLEKVQSRISQLKSENELLKTQHCNLKSEMASVRSKLSKGDLCNTVKIEDEDY